MNPFDKLSARVEFLRAGHFLRRGRWAAVFAAAIFATSPAAYAGLGDSASSVQSDQARMQATLRSTQATAYAVHEMHAPTGTVVREYVASGRVFAVSWRGPSPPNMRQVLSAYFDAYVKAAQTPSNMRAGRRPLRIAQPGFVIELGGHMRSFAGRAYLPDRLPQGVGTETIQ